MNLSDFDYELPPERIQAQTSFICAADVTSNCNDSNAIASLHGGASGIFYSVPATPESIKKGADLFAVYCTPCHGASGKGNGLVAAKFVTPADLTSPELQKARTDGYWQSYLSVGGAVMPSYGESLSAEERWQVVNYLRTLAAK